MFGALVRTDGAGYSARARRPFANCDDRDTAANLAQLDHSPIIVCRDCRHLNATAQCDLRGIAIVDPANTTCASHPAHGALRRPFPIGPVVRSASGTPAVVAPAPDDRNTRERLLDLIAAVDVYGTAPLSPRDAMVVWQLRELGEPRAFHHLDRIDAAMTINHARAKGQLPAASLLAAVGKVAALAMPELDALPPRHGHEFMLHFALPGRLVLLSAVVVGAATFSGLLLLQVAIANWLGSDSAVLLIGGSALLGVFAAGLWILLGRFLLARYGLPFWSRETADSPASGPSPEDG